MSLSTSSFNPPLGRENPPLSPEPAPANTEGNHRLRLISSSMASERESRSRIQKYLLRYLLFLALFLSCDHAIGLFLEQGLARYFGLESPAQILCIGHSHSVLGLDKQGLERSTGMPVAKYARQGANAENRLVMLRHYLSEHPDSVEVVLYDVDAHAFTSEGLSQNSHRLFYPFMDNPEVFSYVRSHAASADEFWLRRFLKLTRFSEVTLSLSIRGWLKKWTNLKFGNIDIDRLRKEIRDGRFRKISFDPEAVSIFEETLRYIRSKNIHLVLLYIPTIDLFNEAEPKKYKDAIDRLSMYAEGDEGITFLNYNPQFSHRHELFYDPIHLNGTGQKMVTETLAKDLKGIIRGKNRER